MVRFSPVSVDLPLSPARWEMLSYELFRPMTKRDGSKAVEAYVGGDKIGIWGSLEHLMMQKTIYVEGPERCYFENNHQLGPELLEMLFSVSEFVGNPGSRWDSGGDSADGARDSRRRP